MSSKLSQQRPVGCVNKGKSLSLPPSPSLPLPLSLFLPPSLPPPPLSFFLSPSLSLPPSLTCAIHAILQYFQTGY